jgi:hypothetical protein
LSGFMALARCNQGNQRDAIPVCEKMQFGTETTP